MYSDGLMVLGPELTPLTQAAATADAKVYYIGWPCQVEGFGVSVTTTFGVSSTDPAIQLVKRTGGFAGTETVLCTLTLGNSNTKLFKGDGTKPAQTVISADTDLIAGHFVQAEDDLFPMPIPAGAELIFRVSVTGSQSTGSYAPVALLRLGGQNASPTTVWVDTTSASPA